MQAIEAKRTMAHATETSSVEGLGQLLGGGTTAPVNSQFVCPFCGSVNELAEGPCPRCTMENTPAGRKATKARIGPWYVLQRRNPAAPGMRFETLLSFVRKGRVRPRSVVRGPTTHQLWRFASQVKGLSREFGLCYSCGGLISAQAALCPQCNRLQDPPADADAFLETPADLSALKAPPAAPIPTAIFLEVPMAGEEEKADAPKPDEAPQPQAVQGSVEGDPVSDLLEFEGDLVIPAINPNAPPPEEDEDEQEIVIPVLAENTPPPTGAIIAIKEAVNPLSPRPREPDRQPGRFIPADPADQSPRRFAGGGRNRLPPPGEPDPHDDDMGGGDPYPIMRPVPHAASRAHCAEVGLFVLILLGAILSGLLYVDPQLRQQTTAWIFHLRWFRGAFPDEATTSQSPRRSNLEPMAATRSDVPARSTAAPDALTQNQRLPDTVAPAVPAPPLDSAPAPGVIAPADQPATAAQAADDAVYNHARTLWRAALDAEAAHHYKQAVDLYEQIKKLPRETWPPPLELYLKSARVHAASEN